MVELAARAGVAGIAVHAFLDGRDTPPRSAARLARVHGRDVRARSRARTSPRSAAAITRWTATSAGSASQQAYELLVDGRAPYTATTAMAALEAAYARGETDEFVEADGDRVARRRADRACATATSSCS